MSKTKLTTKEFIERSIKIHNEEYDYSLSEYVGTYNKVKIICHKLDKNNKEHGVFEQRANDHLNNHGCNKCRYEIISKKFKDSTESFIKKAKKRFGDKYDYSLVNYSNSMTEVKIICKEHGIFEQKPVNHIRGNECPCHHLSKGESLINKILINKNINFIKQFTFDNCKGKKRSLPFDFYLPKYNTCIEFDGKQHYDIKSKFYSLDLIKNDKIKNEYCFKNNIRLIRIINIKEIEIELKKFN